MRFIDVGGGLIHGEARDFVSDPSNRLFLAHLSRELTAEEMEIGSEAAFGAIDILIFYTVLLLKMFPHFFNFLLSFPLSLFEKFLIEHLGNTENEAAEEQQHDNGAPFPAEGFYLGIGRPKFQIDHL